MHSCSYYLTFFFYSGVLGVRRGPRGQQDLGHDYSNYMIL